MKAKCFECGATIQADHLDAIADAFVTHGQANHSWPYPEEAVRNYACNYVEAVEPLTGDTERLPEIGDVTVHPVTGDRVDDWLRFFALNLTYRPRPSCLNTHGAANERQWPRAFGAERPLAISPTSPDGPRAG